MRVHSQGHTSAGKRTVAIVAVLLIAFGLVARMVSPAGALPDTAPPELHGGTLLETSVVADAPADADRTLHFTASLSDNTTGMQYAYAQFLSPTANQYFTVSFSVPYAGAIITPVDVPGQATLPRYAEAGTWTLQSFSMMDVATNQVNLANAAVAATGFPTTFLVTGVDDLVDPEVVPAWSQMLPGTPMQGDAADPALRTFTIETRLTDDLAGVRWISAAFTLGGQWVYPSFSRTAGTELDGTWVGAATVPRYAATGSWQLQSLSLGDRVNNQASLDATQAATAGFPTTFTVTGADDLVPPALVAFDFDPKTFNTVGCATPVQVTAHITDAVSGTTYFQANFNGPAGQYRGSGLSLISGTTNDGIWSGSFTLPFESATGTWTLGNAYGADAAGNQVNFSTSDLTTAGFPTTFEVVAGTGEVCISPDLTLQEGGPSGATTVNMTTQPAADVDVVLAQTPGAGASPGTQLSFSPTTVHFTPENWNVPQPVNVSALDDDTTESNPHTAIISGVATSADPIFDGQAPTATVTIQEQSPTLGVTATPTAANGIDGFSTTWSFTFSNTGPGDASNAGFAVTVPTGSTGFTVVGSPSINNGFGCATSSNPGTTVYTCTRGVPLAAGQSATFTLSTVANGSPGDTPTITAVGTADATPSTPASTATAIATIDTPIFNLRVTNQADVAQQEPGGPVNWTATVENTSTDGEDATGTVLTFDLPAGLDLAGAPTMPGYACAPATGAGPLTITCSGGPALPVTESVSMNVATTVNGGIGASLATTAVATADQLDSDPSDDSATDSVLVSAIADISTTKTVSDAFVESGDTVTWTVTATNTSSTSPATSVTITDNLPPGLSPGNVIAPPGFGCSTTPSSVQCMVPALLAGASAILQFDTVVNGGSGVSYSNTATATATNDPDASNDQASADVEIETLTGSIAGTVTELGTGNPLGGIEVQVFDADMRDYGRANTAPDGTYELGGIDPGDYMVRFTDPSGYYGQQWYDHVAPLSAASTVTITTPGDRVGSIDAALDAGTSISGTVTSESTGLPIEDICVGAFDADAPNFNNASAAEAETASDGTYTLAGLASTPYLVLFRDCSDTPAYALELYDGGSGTVDPDAAVPVTPTGPGATGVDAALGVGGSISGTVYQLPTGTPIDGRCVLAFSPGFGVLSVTLSDAGGQYRLSGVPAGQWYIASGECDSDDGGGFVWHAGATSVPISQADDDADPVGDGGVLVTVAADTATTGINLYFGVNGGGSTPPTGTAPPVATVPGADPADAANATTSAPVSGRLPRTGVPSPDMAILGGVLLGVGLLVVRIAEMRREVG